MRQVIGAIAAAFLSSILVFAQAPPDDAIAQLSSHDGGARLRAARALKEAADPAAAVPLAKAILDPEDAVQFEAIAAELNIFLADKVVTRKRVGYIVEVRNRIAADAAFSSGVLGPRPVPPEVLAALRSATRDDNPRVGVEALYAFGTLAPQAAGAERGELLRASAPEFASMVAAPDPEFRFAAIRVIGRVFASRPGDEAVDVPLGDAVITALNDKDDAIRRAAMDALGTMRYARAAQGLTDLFEYYRHGDPAEAAFGAIARIAQPSSVALFRQQLGSKDPAVRTSAIEGLARAGDRTAASEIERASAADTDARVQLAAAFAAVSLRGAPLDSIVNALRKSNTRDRALGYLIELAPGRTAALGRYLQDPDPRTRTDVAEAIGASGDPSVLALLEPLTRDADAQVAAAAARGVVRLRASATQGRPH